MTAPQATVVYVAYCTSSLDLGWVPHDADVVVVHNDRSLDPGSLDHPGLTHLFSEHNVGFGAGVNLALGHVATARVILCNPDTRLASEHWALLASGADTEVGAIPLSRPDGSPTSVVAPYPTPLASLLMAFRVGRWLPAGRLRSIATRILGRWGRAQLAVADDRGGTWPVATHWVSGAVVSWPTDRLRAVGGFDEGYFLYYEDVDLCRRLADRFPEMQIRLHRTAPGVHAVGASAGGGPTRSVAEAHRLRSAHRYVSSHRGIRWRLVAALTGLRLRRAAAQ